MGTDDELIQYQNDSLYKAALKEGRQDLCGLLLQYGANPDIIKTVYTFKLGEFREPGFAELILVSTTYE